MHALAHRNAAAPRWGIHGACFTLYGWSTRSDAMRAVRTQLGTDATYDTARIGRLQSGAAIDQQLVEEDSCRTERLLAVVPERKDHCGTATAAGAGCARTAILP